MFKDKNILITGGTGSFGNKFIEVVLNRFKPNKVIVFSRDELKQHEMSQKFTHKSMRYFIGDVRDVERLKRAMNNVDIVIHAAALKQVPTCEYNPFETVKTNIIGAQNVIDAAIDTGVKKVLGISTDKAVNPINLYGATKLCAEKIFTQGNAYSRTGNTMISCCRYGNVVSSRGSVIPLFLKQKEKGKITITDKRMTRFWITLDKGVEFVIDSIKKMKGGEIFVPKIPSMKLTELAKAIAPECEMKYIGIRPGEKIHEVLLSEDEARHTVELKDMYVILPKYQWWKSSTGNHRGKKLKEGFCYTSSNNRKWLTNAELIKLINLK